MMDSDIIKRLLDTERRAKNIIDESQNLSDGRLEEIIRTKQADFEKFRENKIRELETAFAEYKREMEEERTVEISRYEKEMRGELLFLEEADRALKETLKLL